MVKNLKILILEDDQNDADLLLRKLKKSGLIYNSEIVQTRKAFESALENFKPDIILADYSLPSFDGVTAFNIKQNISPDIPFIIVSGVIGEENAVELIRNGVTDYALKDKLFVLIPKINRALKEAEKKKEKRIADEELVFQYEEKEKLLAELILANKELNQSAELLQKNLKEISDYKYALDESTIIAITDQKGIIEKVNSNFCKISKYSEEELIGQDHRIINSGYHTKEFIRDLWVTIANGKIWKGELKNKAKDGTLYWVDTTIVPFLNEEGKPYQYLAIRIDITDRKEAEEYLTQRTAQLETANKELAFQIEENEKRASELIIANKLAIQNEEKEKRAVELIIANKELKQANERFELIGKATNEGLWDFNLETNQLWGNEMHQQLYGLSLADPVPNYEEWKNRIHPEDRERIVKAREETIASERNNYITEYRFNTENIGWINIYARTLIERNKEGKPVRLIGSVIDITKRIKNERELAKNENHLRVILQSNPECIKLTGINGELEDMNPAGLAMIEADSIEQIKGKSLLDVIDKPYRKAYTQLTQNVFKGISGKLEFELTGLKGTHRWLETHAVPLKDAKGEIISLLGITRDITERKKTEKEILRVIERYDMIAKATSDTIWDWDITNDKIFYNEGITNVFGYEKTKIENISGWWKNKIHPDDLQIVLEAVAAAFKKQSYNLQLEYRFRCADESFKYIYDRAFVIYDEHKKPCKMIGAMQDVSKLKENEISLIELNENLQKQAKELFISNEELERFAYVASHDLQEPLRMVTSFLTQLEKKYGDVIDDKGKKYIFFAVDGAKRMRKIILDLLEFSRVGRTEDIQEKLDLNELVNEIKILFRKKIEEKSAIIQVGQLPAINAHKVPILQIFQNLISNALKYSREDIPAQIHITAKELKGHWQFAVADNGIGISEEYFDKIFVIFQRLHNKDEYSGTGIGLAITKKIIESQKGKIWVESEEGKGSIFYFTIKKNR